MRQLTTVNLKITIDKIMYAPMVVQPIFPWVYSLPQIQEGLHGSSVSSTFPTSSHGGVSNQATI